MSDTPIKERAKRIRNIGLAKRTWERPHFPAMWRNHTTASHEFQLLDVLRDIRMVLTAILIVLSVSMCSKPKVEVVVDSKPTLGRYV